MENNLPYNIISNHNHRNILVINDLVDVDNCEDLEFEDFDAIFINVTDPINDRVMLAIRWASPLQSEKCRFKPCFVTQRLRGWMGAAEAIVDGYAFTPTDSQMTQSIEEIYNNMRRTNFLLGTEPVVTHAEEIIRVCRYAISRGKYTFSSLPVQGLSSGYMAIYMRTLWNVLHEEIQLEELDYFHKQLIELGYIRRTRFIERIHQCPECGSSNLYFFECCPKCGSSDIRSQSVIHHFRCAHVAPESDYEWDGELRCPKCKRMLRHIGVDYDKPSQVYTCNQCSNTFMYSDMRVNCQANNHKMTPEQLVPCDIEEYEFTPDGIRAFANYDVMLSLSKTGFYGYSSLRDVIDYIRTYNESAHFGNDILIVSRFHIKSDAYLATSMFDPVPPVVKVMRRLFNYKNAIQGNDYYFVSRAKPGEVAAKIQQMEYEIGTEFKVFQQLQPDFDYELIDTYQMHPGEDTQIFMQRIGLTVDFK